MPIVPTNSQAFVSMVNTFPSNCYLNITEVADNDNRSPWMQHLNPNSSLIDDKFHGIMQLYHQSGIESDQGFNKSFTIAYQATEDDGCRGVALENQSTSGEFNVSAQLKGGKSYYILFGYHGYFIGEGKWHKPTEGQGQFSMK